MPLSLPVLEYAAVWSGLGAAPWSHLQEEARCIWGGGGNHPYSEILLLQSSQSTQKI